MKLSLSKWPITITYEIAEDWFDGIEKENLKELSPDTLEEELREVVDDAARKFISAKGAVLALQEAKQKQNDHE